MEKHAKIYRMVTPNHLCPWGVKALDLLKRNGFKVEDKHLKTKEENKEYKEENGYNETPQIFIEGKHLGGYDDLREHLGLGPDPKEGETYQPVIAVFAVTFCMALATSWAMLGTLSPIRIVELFIAFSMCVLGILKLQDLLSFATGFVQYDLLAQRYVPYSYVYPFVEAGAGPDDRRGCDLARSSCGLDGQHHRCDFDRESGLHRKRDLHCACVGGGSSVPLGFISLTENLMMMAMAIWMLVTKL